MDDFDVKTLQNSKDEWVARLLNIITPQIILGFQSIFKESISICRDKNEMDKYLMTFQNLITHIIKWNSTIINNEKNRIINDSHCNYLEDLITCVHIIQLKLLSAIRVSQKQKKIDISIPKLDDFIHKVYINSARKLYKNVYLYELNIPPLQIQKNNREIELFIQQSILDTIRDSIPVETILAAYLDETIEEEFIEEIKQEVVKPDEIKGETIVQEEKTSTSSIKEELPTPTQHNLESNISEVIKKNDEELALAAAASKDTTIGGGASNEIKHLSFDDLDYVKNDTGQVEKVVAPKTIERLEEISLQRNNERKQESDSDDDDDKIKIGGLVNDNISLDILDIEELK
jgi:hypothetical protein